MGSATGPLESIQNGPVSFMVTVVVVLVWVASLWAVGWLVQRKVLARQRQTAEKAEETRHLREQLEERNLLLRALFDSCPMLIGVVQLVPNDIFHIWDNPPALSFFRSQGAANAPRPVLATEIGVQPATIRFWTEKYLESRDTGAPVHWLYKHDSTDGEHFWFNVVAAPVSWDGRENCYFYVINDVTPLKKLEQGFRDSVVAAEEAGRAKTDFLSVMSHEIRTPLTVILGFAESLLSADVTPERQRKGLDAIRRNASSLVRILEDIGDFSRIERGVLPLHFDAVDVGMLAHDTVRVYAEAAARKKIALGVVVSAQLSPVFYTDARRVGQILTALIDNAVKYTHNGRVIVDVQTRVSSKDILIDVVDDGIGMAPQQAEKLFAAFTQLEPPLTRAHGGIGLGLFFARELSRLLGGDLELVESALGKGSRFRVTLVSSRPSGDHLPADALS